MSYSAHAYRDMSKIFGDQIDEIMGSVMNEDEIEVAAETIQIVVSRIADLFEADNPNGFDRERFYTDSKISEN